MNGVALLALAIATLCLQGVSTARFPKWNKLSVKFPRFQGMPETVEDAKYYGWTLISACNDVPNFVGNRYIKDGDYGVILIFDNKGQIAGIQTAVPASAVGGQFKKSPFVQVGNKLYLTAYFIDPNTICSVSTRDADYIGDNLLIQTGTFYSTTTKMPLYEKDIQNTTWTPGKCFYTMGKHYWYNLASDMSCDDFYPVFVMYNGGELNAFGWAMGAHFDSSRYEHPTWDKLDYFFESKTKPQCLKEAVGLSTLHIYLERFPFLNFC